MQLQSSAGGQLAPVQSSCVSQDDSHVVAPWHELAFALHDSPALVTQLLQKALPFRSA